MYISGRCPISRLVSPESMARLTGTKYTGECSKAGDRVSKAQWVGPIPTVRAKFMGEKRGRQSDKSKANRLDAGSLPAISTILEVPRGSSDGRAADR